jgi:hypothetical protein
MKICQLLSGAAILIFGLGQMTGHAQTYYYSGPVNGYIDTMLTAAGQGGSGFQAVLGTLDETLYYDPVAQTLEEVGTVTFSPFNGTFDITGSPLFNPGVLGSATLTIGDNGTVSFDHTSSVSQGWTLNIPVIGSGIYEGQPFSGNWDLSIPGRTTVSSASPTSIIFSEGLPGGGPILHGPGQNVIPGTNLNSGSSDGTYSEAWNLSSAMALAVPETNSLSLLILGLLTMALFSWKRRRTAGSHTRSAVAFRVARKAWLSFFR